MESTAPRRQHYTFKKQVAQLWQKDRAAGWVSFGQKWKTRRGEYFADIIDLVVVAVVVVSLFRFDRRKPDINIHTNAMEHRIESSQHIH